MILLLYWLYFSKQN